MVCKLKLAFFLALAAGSAAVRLPKRDQDSTHAKIIGGELAKAEDFPFIVSLLNNNSTHFCGGSLLNAQLVVTAAHCVMGENVTSLKVRAGSLAWASGGKLVRVSSSIVHPQFNAGGPLSDDIALLKLSTPIDTGSTISYATLPKQASDPIANTSAMVAGWYVAPWAKEILESQARLGADGLNRGSTSENTTAIATELLKVEVPIISRETCRRKYPGEDMAEFITDKMICAGLEQGGKDACGGDSGGPIIDQTTRELIGIVSFGERCGAPGLPGVYTRVGNYVSFITENM